MKALIYNGPRDVQVKTVPDAKIELPTDVFVRLEPGSPHDLAMERTRALELGAFWSNGRTIGAGPSIVKSYNRYLRSLIQKGRPHPGWTKVMRHPDADTSIASL